MKTKAHTHNKTVVHTQAICPSFQAREEVEGEKGWRGGEGGREQVRGWGGRRGGGGEKQELWPMIWITTSSEWVTLPGTGRDRHCHQASLEDAPAVLSARVCRLLVDKPVDIPEHGKDRQRCLNWRHGLLFSRDLRQSKKTLKYYQAAVDNVGCCPMWWPVSVHQQRVSLIQFSAARLSFKRQSF